MRVRFSRTIRITLVAAACGGIGLVAAAAPAASPATAPSSQAWMSIGAEAFQVLRQIRPELVAAASSQVTSSAAGAPETVHILAVDGALPLQLSTEVHRQLHRCGGFVMHSSEAQARAALARMALGRQARPATAAPSYTIDDQETVNALLPLVSEAPIKRAIERLSSFRNRYYDSQHGVQASNQLASAWRQLAKGRSDVSVRQVSHSWPQKSVVLTIQGTGGNAAERVVIGGHLDSINQFPFGNFRAPGADDDASGVASLSEVIRVLLKGGYRPQRTIEFMAYAAEEIGLLGSGAIAQSYATDGIPVVGVMQLDMTNYQGGASDITLIGDYTSADQNTFVANLAQAYLPELVVNTDLCGYGCSDHVSWTNQGYAASFPFEAPFDESNPYIHTASDTLARSGDRAIHAVKFAKLALTFAVELGSDSAAR